MAGLATTTLTRFMNDPAAPMLGLRSIAKIAHVAGIPALHVTPAPPPAAASATPGLADAEAAPVDPSSTGTDRILDALVGGRSAAIPWTLSSHVLENAGYLPGDILIVDLNATPQAGDVVCVQIYAWADRTAQTVFRVYDPPYLLSACRDPALRRPLLVDNNQIIIKGVVTECLRRRTPA